MIHHMEKSAWFFDSHCIHRWVESFDRLSVQCITTNYLHSFMWNSQRHYRILFIALFVTVQWSFFYFKIIFMCFSTLFVNSNCQRFCITRFWYWYTDKMIIILLLHQFCSNMFRENVASCFYLFTVHWSLSFDYLSSQPIR